MLSWGVSHSGHPGLCHSPAEREGSVWKQQWVRKQPRQREWREAPAAGKTRADLPSVVWLCGAAGPWGWVRTITDRTHNNCASYKSNCVPLSLPPCVLKGLRVSYDDWGA